MVLVSVNTSGRSSFCRFPARFQFGPGWWHLDQKQGMESQLDVLSNRGRSPVYRHGHGLTRFMSYPPHRVFPAHPLNRIVRDMKTGAIPNYDGHSARSSGHLLCQRKTVPRLPGGDLNPMERKPFLKRSSEHCFALQELQCKNLKEI